MTDMRPSGINNTPLHRHQHADSMRKYMGPVISLLCLVLCSQDRDDYSIPLPLQTQVAVERLKASLDGGDDVSAHVHEALMSLWMQKWSKMEDNPIPCPTE